MKYTFDIIADATISIFFKKLGFGNFIRASEHVKQLPYRRNQDKNSITCVLDDRCGTCSTKHALLKRLADENGHSRVKLMLGIYKIHGHNTVGIESVLERHGLNYLPEAHNYLKVNDTVLDFTGVGMREADLSNNLLTEIEITPDQVTDYKVGYHRDYLAKWLVDEGLPYSLDEIWQIREECIKEIAMKQCELTTDRLMMRPFRAEDGPMMYALNEDPEVLQYTGDVQFEDVAAASTFLHNYGQYEKYGVGRLVVVLKGTGEILGWCGLKYHPSADEYDIGYRFFKQHWGKGYATESAKAAMDYGFGTLKLDRIIGRARVENLASINVFNKLGMRFVKPYTEDGKNWVLYKVVREI
ncbi:GNAT family N-acetyltransferase [Parapedobacter indicus]|uniref:Protein N-acetyltransferase, RimJ/RimL family n=1 Tax=Parapedobacter indicus TaxID=1477437 RepID=A0A1I3IUP7_9SPHI|nr:GNAT family N-acetyltransferase [Parapedobacter indicus]PPL02297.1 RimJ/RimL family protein N-acetyltransferase [Parapedobacter indicus]SFI51678.1 Protein N-acetyltransferase, RimJ/RimL family [Parapedobacter indicus]